jgi:tetratricopeptide (TPR) repeat protein
MRLVLFLFLAGVCPANEWLREVQDRAAVFEGRRDWAQAEAVYRQALEGAAGPDAFRIRMALCEMVFNQGKHPEAGRLLRELGTPGSPEEAAQAHNAWAALYMVSGNLTAAMRELRLALAAEESAATLHNLASVEAQTGELQAAEEHQRRALSLWRGQFGERHEYVRRALISLSSIQGLRKD